jgi:hypothetical protein
MDKTVIGLAAAIGAMTPMVAAHAEVAPSDLSRAMEANSFAELLQPIPNAVAILKVADEQGSAKPGEGVQLAQDHHHHHHHRYYHHHHHHHRRWDNHHHHWLYF